MSSPATAPDEWITRAGICIAYNVSKNLLWYLNKHYPMPEFRIFDKKHYFLKTEIADYFQQYGGIKLPHGYSQIGRAHV